MADWVGKEVLQVSRGVLLYLSNRVSENIKKKNNFSKNPSYSFSVSNHPKKGEWSMSESVPEINPATRAATGEQGVFRRTASGLTREISGIEHWIYNVFTLLVLTGAAFFYVWAPGQFPATNPILGVVVAGVALIPIFMAYSLIASAMPQRRSHLQVRYHPSLVYGDDGTGHWLWYWLELTGFWIAAMVLSPCSPYFDVQIALPYSPGYMVS
jgi:hypothetical protein